MIVTDLQTSAPQPLLRRLDLSQYDWYREHYTNLPSSDSFNRKNLDKTELWVLEEQFTLSYRVDGKKRTKTFDECVVFDKASSPKLTRSIVDNDALIVLIPALNHDADFGLHFATYEEANEVFYQLIKLVIKRYVNYLIEETDTDNYEIRKWYRKSMRQARWYHRGVETKIGENVYNEIKPYNHWNYGKIHEKREL